MTFKEFATKHSITTVTTPTAKPCNWSENHITFSVDLLVDGVVQDVFRYSCDPVYHADNVKVNRAMRMAKMYNDPARGPAGYIASDRFKSSGFISIYQGSYNKAYRIAAAKVFEVSPDSILQCLAIDSHSSDLSFDEWAGDLGYDSDSIEARNVYRACQNTARRLRNIFGAETYVELLECEE